MRTVVNYIRSLFCCHDFERIKDIRVYDSDHILPVEHKIIYRCRKCGYVQRVRF